MKNLTLLLGVTLFYAGTAVALVPSVDNIGRPAITTCPGTLKTTVHHSDKIIFAILDKLEAANPQEQEKLNAIPLNTPLDIKVRDNPNAVANLKKKVLSFLGASLANPSNEKNIRIDSVEYAAVVCPK